MASPKEVTFARLRSFFHSHLLFIPPRPDADKTSFAGQTIIVTGANTGIGREAARHFLRLGAALVVLAVRDLAKGAAARDDLLARPLSSSSSSSPPAEQPSPSASANQEAESSSRVQVWELDLARHESVARFAARAHAELARLDVLVNNAGTYVMSGAFRRAPDDQDGNGAVDQADEMTVRVNVVSTVRLAVLLLPKLRETSLRHDKEAVCTFTGSFVHFMTAFPERAARGGIFRELADEKRARMGDRYNVSKLLELLLVQQLARHVAASSQPGRVVVSIANPGAVRTDILRDAGFFMRLNLQFLYLVVMRTAEEGARTLVSAAEGGQETHGQYLDDCKVGVPSAWVRSGEGDQVGRQLWAELCAKLELLGDTPSVSLRGIEAVASSRSD